MTPPAASGFPYVPPLGVIEKVNLRADYFEGQIDLKRLRAECPAWRPLSIDPFVFEPEPGAYVVVAKFGTVVFWRCPDRIIDEVLAEIGRLPGARHRDERVQDKLDVLLGQTEDKVTFNEVWLRELTLDKLKVISLALGQSVALDRFEIEMADALSLFHPVVGELRRLGRMELSQREALRHVGFALDIRSAILANLTLFDDPPEAWESEALARLDRQLYDQFDLEERLSAINQKVAYLTDVNSIIINLLTNKKNQRLEWIVILLIALEIVIFVVYDLMR